MKHTFLISLLALSSLTLSAEETLERSFYFDFGVVGRENAAAVANPDANGNYWNNIGAEVTAKPWQVSSSADYSLIASDNAATTLHLTYTGDLFTGNGAGGLATPDADKLGDLAVVNATRDYLFATNSERCGLVLSGLDKTKAYRFKIFASRSATDVRVSKYDIEGLTTTSGSLQVSGTDLGGSGVHQNVSEVYLSDPIFPDAKAQITIRVSKGTSGQYLPINCMRMQEFSGITPPSVVKYDSLTLKGTGVEDGSIDMYRIAKDGATESNDFEAFCTLTQGGTLSILTKAGVALYSGTVAEETGIYNVRFNTLSATPEFVKINRCGIVGNVTTAGWNAAGVALTYRGHGVWSDTIDLVAYTAGTDQERGQFCFNSSWNLTVKTRNGVEGVVGYKPDESLASLSLGDIPMRHGRKEVTLDMRHFTYSIECVSVTDNKITFFGSSVCNGQGASEDGIVKHGYAWQLGQLLTYYEYSNASVNGNKTTNLLARYKGHLLGDCGRYVVIGLGLGNEGLHGAADPQAIYDQWKHNMDSLIRLFQAEDKYVIATNNYPRGDYNATDYAFVKRMNLEMQEWGIPTVNFLGALDNCQGNGQWADGYQATNSSGEADVYHPNEAGHTLFMQAFVPSLFDALAAGKPAPTRQTGNGMKLKTAERLLTTPEATLGSYALALRVRTTHTGTFLRLRISGTMQSVSLPAAAADGAWHTLLISHYNAAGKTYTYLDGTQVDTKEYTGGNFELNGILREIEVGGIEMEVSDLMLWRSALNADEVAALESGKLLQSSLEIYCPLNSGDTSEDSSNIKIDNYSEDSSNIKIDNYTEENNSNINANTKLVENLAQSTNTVTFQSDPTSNNEVKPDKSRTTPEPTPYDLLGRPIAPSYLGIVIEEGSKYLRR